WPKFNLRLPGHIPEFIACTAGLGIVNLVGAYIDKLSSKLRTKYKLDITKNEKTKTPIISQNMQTIKQTINNMQKINIKKKIP
uniref:hypothetical protein n=1 Tax=Proteus mirabilis TaxID=584 RepID=UPI00313EF731